jgi:L-ascorbate metabolism protein UlaG (beta-lactamase superfamily)
MSNLKITWHGHSCFTVEGGGYSIVFDPYAPGSVPGLAPLSLTANQVLCSHTHGDHGYTDAVKIIPSAKNPFRISVIDTFHDDAGGTLRGTDKIHILEFDGLRVAHLGDLGCMPEGSQIALLKDLDAVMIPVGGYYTIDADQAKALVDRISPRVVIPMHYCSDTFGYPVIGRLEEYTSLCDNVVYHDSTSIVIDEETAPQTAVLKF